MKDIRLEVADGEALSWAVEAVRRGHYLHSEPDRRSRPLCLIVRLGDMRVGCLWFGRTQATRCYDGEFTYGSLTDKEAGKVLYDRWEVLNLGRVWFSPAVQKGGALCCEDMLPGFHDRKGRFQSTLASLVVRMAVGRIGFPYLLRYPPVFVDQPYQIRAVCSYCDRTKHKGTLYAHAGFTFARENRQGMTTWYSEAVETLTALEEIEVLRVAQGDRRGARIRGEIAS